MFVWRPSSPTAKVMGASAPVSQWENDMGLAAFNRMRREQAAKAEAEQKAPEPAKAEEKTKAPKAKAKG